MEKSLGSTLRKWGEWAIAGLVALGALILLGGSRAKEAMRRKIGAAEDEAKSEHEAVAEERKRTEGESAADLYRDLTGGDK